MRRAARVVCVVFAACNAATPGEVASPSSSPEVTSAVSSGDAVPGTTALAAVPDPRQAEAVLAARRRSPVAPDEEVRLFPTLGTLDESQQRWSIELHGWIYEPERDSPKRRLAIAVMRGALGLDDGGDEAQIFSERAGVFLADNERGKVLDVELAGEVFRLGASEEDGHFFAKVELPLAARSAGPVEVRALLPEADSRSFATVAHLLAAEGRFIVSDIDDTVKITNVLDEKELLRNTFLRPYRVVPEMSALYRRWLGPGDHLHFVSSSPWQLFTPLADMLRADAFPPSTMHLKRVRPRNLPIAELKADPAVTKPLAIEPLFAKFPQRKFTLVGDSGEKDPEIYGALYRKFPERIERIAIRDVTGEARDNQRYLAAFAGVPAETWELFTAPSALK